ncbi:MAG: biopolymer transporter ExbD [Planctomycetes bacterium]|nr:biopolymer transporter ExbD [Planctomycetota bacterium]
MAYKLATSDLHSWREVSGKKSLPGEMLLDLAPLVDIIFTLILFFMLTSPFVTQWGIKVDLPSLKQVAPVKFSELEITITAVNQIYIQSKPVNMASLRYELRKAAVQDKSVSIVCDSKAQLGVVLEVRDIVLESGVKKLNLRTRLKSE